MKQKSLIKNALFNFTYTGLNLFFPLITAPYISRILGAANLGKVNFATSIVNWFILFAVFGTTTYGVREVAKIRDDKSGLSKLFSEIVFINGLLSFLVSIIYFILVFNVSNFNNELPLFLIMSLSIILNMFSIDWFFQGIEEYKYITIRSAIFKTISLISIFLFIKSPNNYTIYGLISVSATSLSGILNFIYSKKFVKINFRNIDPLRHVRALSVFFIHTLVVSVYTNLDQTLLGFLVDTKSVAFMNRSKTVTSMAIAVSTSISNVTSPRASFYLKNDLIKFYELLKTVPNFIMWITIPITMGCIVLAPNIMFILGGEEFQQATILLRIIAVVIILSPLSAYLQNQVLIPTGNEKLGLKAAIFSSIISIVFNMLLITRIGFIGAGITVLISELSAVLIRFYMVKKILRYKEIRFINKSSIIYAVSALIMSVVVVLIKGVIPNLLISFFVGALAGAIIYFGILFLFKEKIMLFIWSKIKLGIKK